VNVHWTDTAVAHLVAIYERIAQDAQIDVLAVVHGAQLLPPEL
jgi:plasmid stabilization system protein ParE